MKIAVLIKEVPDTYGDRKLSLETGLVDRGANDPVLDEIGERALEFALSYADRNPDTEVVVVSMGPASAVSTIRKGLSMGAASAVHVADDGLTGADLGLTAEVLAGVIERSAFDLIVAGNKSTDGAAGMLPAMVAERLDLPQLTGLGSVELSATQVRGTRTTDDATMTLSADLPAVITITEALPEGRFPNFKGIMAAKKKRVETLSLGDLGISTDPADSPRSIMVAVTERPARGAGIKLVDDGDAGKQLAEFLIKNRLA